MKTYRTKQIRTGISVLQRRHRLIFWKTLAYGTTHTMTARAISLEREHLQRKAARKALRKTKQLHRSAR